MAALQASAHTLFWALVVLYLLQVTAGMLIAQLVEPCVFHAAEPVEARCTVFEYYGTFWRATVTLSLVIVIAVNASRMALQLQHRGQAHCARLGASAYATRAKELYPTRR